MSSRLDGAGLDDAGFDGAASEEFLRPAEAAKLLHVSPQTMSRWAKEGRIGYVVTLGGHRRFRASEVRRLALHGAGLSAD